MGDLLTTLDPPAMMPGDTLPNVGSIVAENADTVDNEARFDDFDWTNDDSVLLGEQLSIAVYRNRAGGVVIRRERTAFEDEDHYVVLRDEQAVRVFITALQKELKGAGR